MGAQRRRRARRRPRWTEPLCSGGLAVGDPHLEPGGLAARQQVHAPPVGELVDQEEPPAAECPSPVPASGTAARGRGRAPRPGSSRGGAASAGRRPGRRCAVRRCRRVRRPAGRRARSVCGESAQWRSTTTWVSRRAAAADSGRDGQRTSASVGLPNNSSALSACSSSTAGVQRAAVAWPRCRGCSTPSRPAMRPSWPPRRRSGAVPAEYAPRNSRSARASYRHMPAAVRLARRPVRPAVTHRQNEVITATIRRSP